MLPVTRNQSDNTNIMRVLSPKVHVMSLWIDALLFTEHGIPLYSLGKQKTLQFIISQYFFPHESHKFRSAALSLMQFFAIDLFLSLVAAMMHGGDVLLKFCLRGIWGFFR